MAYPLTSTQQRVLDDLKLTNTDNRALRIVEAAFHARNANSPSAMRPLPVVLQELNEVVDEVAG